MKNESEQNIFLLDTIYLSSQIRNKKKNNETNKDGGFAYTVFKNQG